MVSRNQSVDSRSGIVDRAARPWLATGTSSDRTTSITSIADDQPRQVGRHMGTRCTWIHISSSVTSSTDVDDEQREQAVAPCASTMKLRLSVPPEARQPVEPLEAALRDELGDAVPATCSR